MTSFGMPKLVKSIELLLCVCNLVKNPNHPNYHPGLCSAGPACARPFTESVKLSRNFYTELGLCN